MLLAAVCGALTFAGCSTGKDNDVDPEQLTGKWECYKTYCESYNEWDTEFGEGIDLWIFEFRDNGTGACLDGDLYTDPWEEITYSIDGQMLTVFYPSDNYSETWRIDKLTSSELVLAQDEEDHWDIIYFKRIK